MPEPPKAQGVLIMWKEFDIYLVSGKLLGMGIDKNFPSKANVDMSKVIAYFDTSDDETPESTCLIFMGGENITVLEPYENIENFILNGQS